MTESSFDKIKKLIKIVGGKVIIVEDGKPTMVVVNIDEYVDFKNTKDSVAENLVGEDFHKREIAEKINKANKDIDMWRSKQEERMLKQLEIENKYQESRREEENRDDDEITVERL